MKLFPVCCHMSSVATAVDCDIFTPFHVVIDPLSPQVSSSQVDQ